MYKSGIIIGVEQVYDISCLPAKSLLLAVDTVSFTTESDNKSHNPAILHIIRSEI